MDESTAPPADPDLAWKMLAARALRAQRRGDEAVAIKLVQRIATEHDEVVRSMVAWMDTLLFDGFGITEFARGGAGIVFGNEDADTLEYRFADGSQPPEVVWSGRLFAARAAGDEDTFNALLDTVMGEGSSDLSWGRHVLTVLRCTALTFNAVRP